MALAKVDLGSVPGPANFRRATAALAANNVTLDAFMAGLTSLPVYADNAAATTGGLAVGQFYRTATGVVMVRY